MKIYVVQVTPKPLRDYVWRDEDYTEYAIFEVSV